MTINTQYLKLATAEMISGTKAVSLNSSGQLVIAKPNTASKMPAVGVVVDNIVSGNQAKAYYEVNAVVSISGTIGNQVFVGTSGELIATSGNMFSGAVQQIIGFNYTSGALVRI